MAPARNMNHTTAVAACSPGKFGSEGSPGAEPPPQLPPEREGRPRLRRTDITGPGRKVGMDSPHRPINEESHGTAGAGAPPVSPEGLRKRASSRTMAPSDSLSAKTSF